MKKTKLEYINDVLIKNNITQKNKLKEYTSIEAIVELEQGIATLRGVCALTNECRNYEKEIFIINNKEKINLKNMFEILVNYTAPKDKVTIYVEGSDDFAKNQALRIYSALTSKDAYDMRFKTFANYKEGDK